MPLIPGFGRQRQANLCESKVSLVYKVSSKRARTDHREALSQKQQQQQSKKKEKEERKRKKEIISFQAHSLKVHTDTMVSRYTQIIGLILVVGFLDLSFFFKKKKIIIYFTLFYVHWCGGIRSPGTRVTDSCELPCGC